MPSSGWMRSTKRLGCHASSAPDGNARWGTGRNWTEISDTRRGIRLPVRR